MKRVKWAIADNVLSYLAEDICEDCGQHKGNKDFPCPFCGPGPTVQEQLVVRDRTVRYAEGSKIVAKHPSSSQPGVFYEVRAVNGKFHSCSCPGYFYRKTCWHRVKFEDNK